jgi:hypothetical protein
MDPTSYRSPTPSGADRTRDAHGRAAAPNLEEDPGFTSAAPAPTVTRLARAYVFPRSLLRTLTREQRFDLARMAAKADEVSGDDR